MKKPVFLWIIFSEVVPFLFEGMIDNLAFIEVFVQFIIYDGEMQLRGEHHPVRKGIGLKFHTIIFVTAGLPVEYNYHGRNRLFLLL